MMFATALALLSQEFHGKERGTAFGLWGATIGAAVAIGPLAGGMLTSWLSWRWIFLVNIPIGAAAIALGAKQLHESSDPEHSRLDPLGLVTLTGGLLLPDPRADRGERPRLDERRSSSRCSSPAVVLLVVFVASQARERTTMIDLTLFRRPAFVGAQTTAFAISSSMFAMFLYLTLYLQNILGLSPLQTACAFLPLSLVSFFAAPIAGPPVGARADPVAARCRARAERDRDVVDEPRHVGSHWTVLLPGFIIGGVGIGMVNAPLATTAVSTVRAGARRDGVGDQQHVPPARDRDRHRRARRDLREQGRPERVRAASERVARASFVARACTTSCSSAPASPRSAPCSPPCSSAGRTSSRQARRPQAADTPAS